MAQLVETPQPISISPQCFSSWELKHHYGEEEKGITGKDEAGTPFLSTHLE